ncbi:elongation factor P [Candidatus Cytomitobacter indipagum]|nr:elongation factor P [Candidatus Cytomitobacter indipagum]
MNQKVSVADIKPGNIVVYKDKLFKVRKTEHVKPGKGGAFIKAELKGVDSETKINERFRAEEYIEKAILEEKQAKFLYESNGECCFMFMDDFEQFEIQKSDFEPISHFLSDGIEIKAMMYEDDKGSRVISFDFANPVVMEIIEADPAIKGQTAASSYKNAVLENGMKILVPTYIDQGDKVVVDPSSCSYVERYKNK